MFKGFHKVFQYSDKYLVDDRRIYYKKPDSLYESEIDIIGYPFVENFSLNEEKIRMEIMKLPVKPNAWLLGETTKRFSKNMEFSDIGPDNKKSSEKRPVTIERKIVEFYLIGETP